MGNYNPRAPYILGEEWVPIRDETIQFAPGVNAFEVGHRFTLATARQVGYGRYYIPDFPPTSDDDRAIGMAIYAAGTADESGPIRRITIPVRSAIVSGTGTTLINASTVQQALYSPADGSYVRFALNNNGVQGVMLSFDVNRYASELIGKRILNLGLMYTAETTIADGFSGQFFVEAEQGLPPITNVSQLFGTLVFDELNDARAVRRFEMGDGNRLWTAGSYSYEALPWRWTDIARFATGASVPLTANLSTVGSASTYTSTDIINLYYVALDIIYCEEQRLYVAGSVESFFGTPDLDSFIVGTNTIPLRSLQSLAANPIIPAGIYDVVVHSINVTSPSTPQVPARVYPELNALRELYQIPPHPGVNVAIPFPTFDNIGAVLTQTETHVLPQLSLHTTGGTVVTEPHVYGRQGAAQVYGSNTATQEIYDDILPANAVFPQVRFYARRFGDTTIPLALTGTGSLSGSTVQISVSDFDTLTEIVDGWKEITLRFASAPTMGSLVSPEPSWAWSAAGETAGNRWEILAGCAPAISGIPGNLFNLAPGQLGAATYQPPAGSTVELTWMPQGVASPWVSGASADQGCDAVLIFSQDPPTITGVGLSQLTQTVTGIGLDCGSTPCCIPTGIPYQRITWSATSLPATGFGAYELQRWDTTPGAQFETIMLASNPAVTGFNDYEARVGITSVYRIRALNILNFAGAWSTQVSGAPPTPGVTGGCSDSTGALIFTSNAAQSGAYNAAYVMQWEREPVEDFKLPEADMVRFQPMYQRNGMVAFHGTERGLEQFTRTLLIQAGAIDPIRLADVKTLRDLAWAQLPYVCVRDDVGDRWFANVRVPTVNARQQRTKYFAQIAVTELTQCPYAVNP